MKKGKIVRKTSDSLEYTRIENQISKIIGLIFKNEYEVHVDDNEWSEIKSKEIDTFNSFKLNSKREIDALISKLKKEFRKEIIIKQTDKKDIKLVGQKHKDFETLLNIISTGLNVFIVGPAGSGKTTAAADCAKALDLEFYFTGAIASEYKLTGFIDANGSIVNTQFREAYEKGGLFLFDEIDASFPQAILAFNAALANDYMDFPDKKIIKHKKFRCIAAANTYGQGADRQYVGRNQLDAATLDRFVFLDWNYDEKLELELADNDKWAKHIQRIRSIIDEKKIRHILSPRASIYGAKLLASGIDWKKVEELIIWKGIDNTTRQKILDEL